MNARRLVKWIVLLALLAGGGYYAYRRAGGGQAPTIQYLTQPAVVADIRKVVNATGEISAAQLVSVGAQVSGQIKKLHVVLGQSVKRGDPVAEIDSVTQENDLKTNTAKLATFEAQKVAREVDLRIAQSQYAREQTLAEKNANSREDLENAEKSLAAAKVALAEVESQIVQTRIAVDTAKVNLGYTRIVAPFDGTVVSIPVEEGQTVNANQTTPTIAQVADLSRMEIKMQISEGDVTRVKPGMPVFSTILSEPERPFRGELHAIDPGLTTLTDGGYSGSADSSSAVYYYGKFTVPNQGALRIGMTTQNTIVIDSVRNALTVPTIAIRHEVVDAPAAARAPSSEAEATAMSKDAAGDARRAVEAPSPAPSAHEKPSSPVAESSGTPPPAAPSTGTASPSASTPDGEGTSPRRRAMRAYVEVLTPEGQVERRYIVPGLSDNLNTAVASGDLKAGERVITAQMSTAEISTNINSRRPGGPGGGPPMR